MSDQNQDSTPIGKPINQSDVKDFSTKLSSEKPPRKRTDKLHLVDTWDTSPLTPYAIGVCLGNYLVREKVLVSDLGPKINVFTLKGNYIEEWVFSNNVGSHAITRGLAVDKRPKDGRIYVALSTTNWICVLNRDGTVYSNWQGIVASGANPGESDIIHPNGIVVLRDGNLIISCTANHSLNYFTPDGAFIKTIGSQGDSMGQLHRPSQLAYDDRNGDIYVAEIANNRISVFNSIGRCLRTWGASGSSDGQFNAPCGIALDKNKEIVFVSEIGNKRIQVFKTDGSFLSVWSDDEYDEMYNMAMDSDGRLYVTCYNHKVKVFEYRS